MKTLLIVLSCLAAVSLIAVGLVGRGPEGTALRKEAEDRVLHATAECGLQLRSTTEVAPDTVHISRRVLIKHVAKKIGSRLGFFWFQGPHADDYQLSDSRSAIVVHYLLRFSGDHLIGMEVRFSPTGRSAADCLVAALKKEFRDIPSLILTQET